jgi:hypothetical protein
VRSRRTLRSLNTQRLEVEVENRKKVGHKGVYSFAYLNMDRLKYSQMNVQQREADCLHGDI